MILNVLRIIYNLLTNHNKIDGKQHIDEEMTKKYGSDWLEQCCEALKEIGTTPKPLPYHDWLDLNEVWACIEFSESGQDREVGFDYEREMERKYVEYTKSFDDEERDLR